MATSRFFLRSRAAALVAACSFALALAPAAHAGAWLAPSTYSATAPADAQVAVDSQVRITVAWQNQLSGPAGCNVQVVDRAASAFETQHSLSGAVAQADCAPQLASDDAGEAVVVWVTPTNVMAATRDASGTWSAATPLDAVDTNFSAPRVAMNSSGAATAVWIHHDSSGIDHLRTAHFTGGAWHPALADVATGTGTNHVFTSPSVALDASGNARAVWEDTNTTGVPPLATLKSASATSGNDLGTPTAVLLFGGAQALTSTQKDFRATQVAADGHGGWLATWEEVASRQDLASAFDSGSGTFKADNGQFIGADQPAVDPAGLAFKPDGSAVLVWSYLDDNSKHSVLAVIRPPGADFDWSANYPGGKNIVLPGTSATFASQRSVVVDPQGGVTIVFTVGGSVFGRDGADLTGILPAQTAGSGSSPSIALSAAHYRAAAWSAGSAVDMSVFDNVGPSDPANLNTPASGAPGDTLSFTATSSDYWSPASIEWSFGDNTTHAVVPSGTAATHFYGAAGVYTATATGVDSSGNKSAPVSAHVTITDSGSGGNGGNAGGGSGDKLPPPNPGVTANVSVLTGDVLAKKPGTASFVPVTGDEQVPIGTLVDASKGSLEITVADVKGRLASGVGYQGRFRLTQPHKEIPATLVLWGGKFESCKKPAPSGRASTSKRRPKFLQQVWAKGKFKTKGRYGAAVVRGTNWLTADSCSGTLVKVRSGVVVVHDFKKRRNVVVRGGRQYLAHS